VSHVLKRFGGGSRSIVLIIYAVTTLFPLYWLIISSLKDKHQIYQNPFGIPTAWHWENYSNVWKTIHMSVYFKNSVIVSFFAVAGVLLVGSMASYALVRMQRGAWLYSYFTIGIIIPVHAILIPSFVLLKQLHLYDSHLGLILIYVVSNLSLGIFILYGFMRGLPLDLEEAAAIDGYGRVRIFISIVLPLSKPGLATIGTLAFLNCWNEYLFAFTLIPTDRLKTLTQGVMSLTGQYATDYGLLCAGLIFSILPVWLMYLVFQEQIVKGMTAGAVKG
jgi:raffinose/stachyose/melibiose transport system permease protein